MTRPKKATPKRSKEITVVLADEDLDLIEELSYLDGDSPLPAILKKCLRWYGAQLRQGGLNLAPQARNPVSKPEPKLPSQPKPTVDEDDPMSMLDM